MVTYKIFDAHYRAAALGLYFIGTGTSLSLSVVIIDCVRNNRDNAYHPV